MNEAVMTGKLLRKLIALETDHPEIQYANTDFDNLRNSAEFLESLFPNWVFTLCKVQHVQLPYVSGNCQAILGYSAGYLKSLSPEDFFGLICPDDAKSVRLCFEYVHEFRKSIPMDPKDYRFALHYRLRSARQGYVYVLAEHHAFQNKSGKYVYFALFKNLTHQQPFTQVKAEIFQRSTADFRKINEYMPRTAKETLITARERDILRGIQQGLTSKQIADKLFLSVFTVRNHRNNLFKKTQARNMVELLNVVDALPMAIVAD